MSLNQKYLTALAKYPLPTKSVTAGVLASLNEILATCFSGQFQVKEVSLFGRKYTIKHVLSPKVLTMIIYGALVATPVSHFYYKVLNRVFTGKLSPRMKVLQLLTSLVTITPFLSGCYVSWLSIINSYRVSSKSVCQEAGNLLKLVRAGLKNNFWLVYRTSTMTSVVAMTIAQNLVPPELWVVFFNVVYFVVGTVQNTKVKLRQRREQAGKPDLTSDAEKSEKSE